MIILGVGRIIYIITMPIEVLQYLFLKEKWLYGICMHILFRASANLIRVKKISAEKSIITMKILYQNIMLFGFQDHRSR